MKATDLAPTYLPEPSGASRASYRERLEQLRSKAAHGDTADLIRIHDNLMAIAPHLRIGNRWGSRTSYTASVREPEAMALTDGKLRQLPNGQGRYRIECGITSQGVRYARLEFWEPAPLYCWDVWDDDAVTARAWEWLKAHQPATEILLDIDTRLLGLQSNEDATPTKKPTTKRRKRTHGNLHSNTSPR